MKLAAITAASVFTLIPCLFAQEQTIVQASAPSRAMTADVPQTPVQIQQWRGGYGDPKKHTEVVTTAGDWLKLWTRLNMQAPQALDEKRQMGVCIYIGQQPSSGFKPYIVSALERDGKMVVSYSTGHPMPGEEVTPAITQPWVAALIPKSALPVVFKEI
jgi:hypothetical protein